MKNVSFVLLGLLVSISVGLTAQERINAEDLKEISLERKVEIGRASCRERV